MATKKLTCPFCNGKIEQTGDARFYPNHTEGGKERAPLCAMSARPVEGRETEAVVGPEVTK